MYEMYEIAQQAKYRLLGVDEMFKTCDGWYVQNWPSSWQSKYRLLHCTVVQI